MIDYVKRQPVKIDYVKRQPVQVNEDAAAILRATHDRIMAAGGSSWYRRLMNQ